MSMWTSQRSSINGGVGVTPTSTSKVLGQKRKQGPDDSSLNDQQRFTKRFNLLSIDGSNSSNSNLYIPVNNPAAAQNGPPLPRQNGGEGEREELMQVDDTAHRVYIHDLDAELAEDDSPISEHPPLVFLPDIEARLSKLPRQVLLNRGDSEENGGQELVLYSTPKSLTVDEGHDVVRKAIIEARQRAQEKSVEEARMRQVDMDGRYGCAGKVASNVVGTPEMAHGYSVGYEADIEDDPDAMDIG
ncbi:hypothetical protein LTR56_002649 [Elasticomyces elasticus]|nr:hypothetical protein LTR22_021651 [Elasticomyces elasticus]KAK3657133.1 hypothetical protein LTR56_002649 [Elasticomyces elasticus]KAK4905516.1 hypothetical protein LTR49_025189 [Elasticomyces elasticus]KAK5742778.1 hypothetical protein LTS12_024099 [Elasticomyces elasticus]